MTRKQSDYVLTSDVPAEQNYCGRGVCAAMEGHEGMCAEASGWDSVDPGPATPVTETDEKGGE